MKRNEKGFSVVEIVLVLLVVSLVGGVGYFVYKSHHKTNTASVTTTTDQANSTPTKTEPTIPDGFTQYKATDLGVSFAYPKEWGTPSFKTLKAFTSNGSTTPLSGVVGGYYGTFSGSTTFAVRTISKSNVHEPYGEADPYLGSGFCVSGDTVKLEDSDLTPLPEPNGIVDYKNSGAKCSRAVTVVKTIKTYNSYVVKVSCQQGCTDYLVAITKISTVPTDISAIAFTSTDVSQSDVLAQVLSTVTQL